MPWPRIMCMRTTPGICGCWRGLPIVGLVKYDRQAERLTKYPLAPVLSAWLVVTFWLTGRMDSGCHRARVSITSTGEQNVLRTGFSTTKPTRIASTITPLSRSIRIGAACCGRELEMGLISSICARSSSASYRHLPNSPNSLSPGKVTAIYQEPNGILWVGFYPRALDQIGSKDWGSYPLCSRPGKQKCPQQRHER